MALRERLTRKVGKVFTKVTNRLETSLTIKLLKASDDYGEEFDTVLVIEGKRFFEYSNFRKNFLLEIADDSAELTAAIEDATHVQVDDLVYMIRTGDTEPPKSTDVTWKLFCDRYIRDGAYAA